MVDEYVEAGVAILYIKGDSSLLEIRFQVEFVVAFADLFRTAGNQTMVESAVDSLTADIKFFFQPLHITGRRWRDKQIAGAQIFIFVHIKNNM